MGACCHLYDTKIVNHGKEASNEPSLDSYLSKWQYTLGQKKYVYDSVEDAIKGLLEQYEELYAEYERIYSEHQNQREQIHELWDELDPRRSAEQEEPQRRISRFIVLTCPEHGMIQSQVEYPGVNHIISDGPMTHCPMYTQKPMGAVLCNLALHQTTEEREYVDELRQAGNELRTASEELGRAEYR
jgi:hypothetical protein